MARRGNLVAQSVVGGLFILGALCFLSLAWTAGNWGMVLGALLLGGFAALILYGPVSQTVAGSAFRAVHFEVLSPAKLGGTVEVMVVLDPARPLTLRPAECTLTLNTTERAHYSAGTQSRTYRESLWAERLALTLPAQLTQRLEQRIAVQIPRDIPPSWSGRSNWLTTTLSLRVDIDGWPDLQREATVQVLPEVAS